MITSAESLSLLLETQVLLLDVRHFFCNIVALVVI